MKNFLLKLLLDWRLKRANMRSVSRFPRYPLGIEIVRGGITYLYVRRNSR